MHLGVSEGPEEEQGRVTHWVKVELLPDGLMCDELVADTQCEAQHGHSAIQKLSRPP